MSAIANVVAVDSVPANKTLYPLSASLSESNWTERAANAVAANRTLRTGLNLSHSKRPTDRVFVLYKAPKETQVDGRWVLDSTGVFEGNFIIPDHWTTLERRNFAAEVASVVAGQAVKLSVERDPPSHG